MSAIESGIKDERKDIFEVFNSIFWRKLSRNAQVAQMRRLLAIKESRGAAYNAAAAAEDPEGELVVAKGDSGPMFAMKCADNHGDYELIYNGVHENLHSVPYNDPRCIKTCHVMDWLGFQDQLQRRVDENQHWFLLAYMPTVAAAVHVTCSVDTRHKLDLPREVSE